MISYPYAGTAPAYQAPPTYTFPPAAFLIQVRPSMLPPPLLWTKTAGEVTNWQRACKDKFEVNAPYYPSDSAKIAWAHRFIDNGPSTAWEKHTQSRKNTAATWRELCTFLLNYVGPPKIRQQTA